MPSSRATQAGGARRQSSAPSRTAGTSAWPSPADSAKPRSSPFLDTHGLPRPRTNARITHRAGTGEVDAAWPDHRLIVELDGYDVHTTRRSFEDDRARDRALTADGWRVVRITWRQPHRSTAPAGELRTLLGRST
jgi:Protein of unknown function (DUF559)